MKTPFFILDPNRMGPCFCPTNLGHQELPHPPPRTWHPPLPQLLLPRPPNLICLLVGGHSLLRNPDFGRRIPGAPGAERGAVQGFFTPNSLRALALGGVAPGFSFGLRGCRAYPQLSPRLGRVRPAGSGLAWAARLPLLKSWDPTGRSAAPREPGLCAHRHPPPSCSG